MSSMTSEDFKKIGYDVTVKGTDILIMVFFRIVYMQLYNSFNSFP